MKSLIFILIVACFVVHAISSKLWYKRVLTCKENNTVKCTKWQETSKLMYRRYYSTFCFSENTHVLTIEGPKSMHQLAINDSIFALDPSTGKPTYSKITAWLHRDTQAIADYDTITTQKNTSFEASDFHSIAFVNQEGQIQFKFAGDLMKGDALVGFPESENFIDNVNKLTPKRGLYSPFTEAGNFFIYSTSFDPHQNAKDSPMIMVHVLSQVIDPQSEFWKAEDIINLWEFLGWNRQPHDSQIYIHPLFSTLSFIFGSHWVPVLQEVKYYFPGENPINLTQKQIHLQRRSSSSSRSFSSRSYHPPAYHPPAYHPPVYSYSRPSSYSPSYSSSYGSTGTAFLAGAAGGTALGLVGSSYYSGYGYHNTNRKRQKEQADKLSAVVLAHTILQEIYLL